MSSHEANIALLLAGMDAFNRDDQAAVVQYFDPEVESAVGPGLMNTGTWHGHDGYHEMVTGWNEAWGEVDTELVSFDTPDEHHVIAEIHQTATGSASGVPVAMTVFYLVEIRGDKAVRFHIYADRESALEAIRK
jgi:ketosteroid isomerase-like protein